MITKNYLPNRKELTAVFTSFPSFANLTNHESEDFGHQAGIFEFKGDEMPTVTDHNNNNQLATDNYKLRLKSNYNSSCNSKFGTGLQYSLPPMEAAVRIRNGQLHYGSGTKIIPVLNGINMTVPVGSIYGLLGPSGCGKTTLLRCVIGCLKLKSGLIRVYSHQPGDPRSGIPGSGCGYMPQEVALDDDLTIDETLTYYARLHSLDYSDIRERIDHLVDFLDLPSSKVCRHSKLVGELSGGQRRRVSFAAALIHKPRLIILDEPTVGVDPILRERIWEALIKITEVDKMTVIITTHYIEETRRAHSVAFMRKGVLLVEDSPSALISRFESSSLEDVFYKLSLAQKKQTQLFKQTIHKEPVKGLKYRKKRTSISIALKNNGHSNGSQGATQNSGYPIDISFNSFESTVSSTSSQGIPPHQIRDTFGKQLNAWLIRYQTVTHKIMIQSFRQSNLVFLQFFLPLLSLFLFCTCIGHTPKNVQLMVVNEESPELLSLIFLRNINAEIISITRSSNLDEAFKVVRSRDAWGVLHIRANFSSAMIRRALFYESETEISNDTITESTIKIYADLTNRVLSVTMQRTLDAAFESFTKDALTELDYNPKLVQYPIILADAVYGKGSTMDYFAIRDYGIPGLLVILTYSCAFASTVLILNGESAENKDDFMDRNFVAGVTTAHLIMSHMTSRLLVMTVNVLTLLLVAIYFFEAPSRGNVFVSILLLILQSVAGLTHGMLISSLSKSFFMAMVLSNFVLLGMFIISGVLWPLSSLPTWLRYISYTQPTTIPTDSLRYILSKGMPFTSFNVLSGFAVTIFWIIVFFTLSLIVFR